MTTITNLPVCDMPHGVKVNHAGSSVYVSCMHSDELLELDISTLSVVRRVKTGSGHAMAGGGHDLDAHKATAAAPTPAATAPAASAPSPAAAPDHAGHDMGSMSKTGPKGGPDLSKECAPTFVSVSPDDKTLYAACNVGYTMQVWDAATMTFIKELPTGKGAYNVEPSPDGKFVIVTNKKDQSISVFDAQTLTEVARIPTTKKIVHGIAYSPDSKLAFITQESIGADPGAVDMIDLTTLKNIGDPAGAGTAHRHFDLAEAVTFEALTALDGPTVLARAKEFFAERVPLNAAFPETRGRGLAGAPRPGWGGSGDRGGAGRWRRARAGVDALLRPGARSLPVHAAAHGRRVTAATDAPGARDGGGRLGRGQYRAAVVHAAGRPQGHSRSGRPACRATPPSIS